MNKLTQKEEDRRIEIEIKNRDLNSQKSYRHVPKYFID